MRSVGAVLAGFVAMTVLVVFGSAAAVTLLQGGSTSPTPPYLLANLSYSTAFAAVGGYLTARLAPRRPLSHVAALALLVAMMGALSALGGSGESGQPAWYGWTITLLGAAGTLLGGAAHARRGPATLAVAAGLRP